MLMNASSSSSSPCGLLWSSSSFFDNYSSLPTLYSWNVLSYPKQLQPSTGQQQQQEQKDKAKATSNLCREFLTTISPMIQFMVLSTSPLFFLYYHHQQQQEQPLFLFSDKKKNTRRQRRCCYNDSDTDTAAAKTTTAAVAPYDYYYFDKESGGTYSSWVITNTVAKFLLSFWGPELWIRLSMVGFSSSSFITATTSTTHNKTKNMKMTVKKQQQQQQQQSSAAVVEEALATSSTPPVSVTESKSFESSVADHGGCCIINTAAPNNNDEKMKKFREEVVADDRLASADERCGGLSSEDLSIPEGETNLLPAMNIAASLPLSQKEVELAVADAETLQTSLSSVLGSTSRNGNNTAHSLDQSDDTIEVSCTSPFNHQQQIAPRIGGWCRRSLGGGGGGTWVAELGNVENNLYEQFQSLSLLGHVILLHVFLFGCWMTYLATVIVLDYTLSHHHQHHASTH